MSIYSLEILKEALTSEQSFIRRQEANIAAYQDSILLINNLVLQAKAKVKSIKDDIVKLGGSVESD